MACQEFIVLYTHQKTKKSKVWQDGILKAAVGGNKAILCDERGQVLDSIFVKFKIKPGDDLECDKYLITVESEKVSGTGYSDQPKDTDGPKLIRNDLKSFASSSLHLPTGLKRKYMGFKGPRQLEKKTTIEDPIVAVLPTTKGTSSSFPSEFYASSPLFSVPCKKKKEAYQFPLNEDDFMKNDGDTACTTFSHFAEENNTVLNKNCNAYSGHLKPVLQMNSGVVKTDYCSSSNGVGSQKIRSKAEILTILNMEQKHSKAPEMETTASLKNLPSTLIKTKFHQESLSPCEPSRNTGCLFQEKMIPFLGCTDNASKATTEHKQPVQSSENRVQTKSQWDVYLPCPLRKLTDEAEIDDAECNKDVSDPQPVLNQFKKSGTGNGSEYSEDHEIISQLPLLGISTYPVTESSVKNHSERFVQPECVMSKESDIEAVPSFDSIHYSKCVGELKTLEEKHTKPKKHIMTDNLEAFCHQSQNESSPIISFSDSSLCGNIHDSTQQFAEVNFNLLETLDFSDTEVEELPGNGMILQGPSCFKEECNTNTQKNHKEMLFSDSGNDKLQSTFLQDKEVNDISGSQSLQLCDTEMSNRIKENSPVLHFLKEPRLSKAAAVDKKRDANSTMNQNLGHHGNLVCTDRDLLTDSDIPCEVIDNEYPDQTIQLQKTNILPHVTATSNSCFMEKSNEKSREVIDICDNMKPVNSLLTITEKYNGTNSFPQYASSKDSASEIMDELDFRPVSEALTCKTLDKSEMSKIELEKGADVLNYSSKPNKENGKDSISLKPVDSLSFPLMENSFRLISSLTKHTTALEMIEEMNVENTGILFQRDELTEKHELTGHEAKQNFAVVSSVDLQISSCLHSAAPKLNSFSDSNVEKPTPSKASVLHDHSPFKVADYSSKEVEFHGYQLKGSAASELMIRRHSLPLMLNQDVNMTEFEIAADDSYFSSAQEPESPVLSDFIKLLGSNNLSEDDEVHVADEHINKEFNFVEEASNVFLTFNESSKLGNQITTSFSSNLNLDFTTCASKDLNMIFPTEWTPSQVSDCHFSSSSSSKKTAVDLKEQEFLMSRIVPDLPADNTRNLFRMEESTGPGSDDMSVCLPSRRTQTPFVTVPVDEKSPDREVYSSLKIYEQDQQSFSFSEVNMYDKSKTSGPEDRMCETSVAKKRIKNRHGVLTQCAFPNVSEQKKASKWEKYQNIMLSNLRTQNSSEVAMTDDIREETGLGMQMDDTGASRSYAFSNNSPDSMHEKTMKSMLCKQLGNLSSQDSVSEGKKLSLQLNQKFSTEEAAKVLGQLNRYSVSSCIKNTCEAFFPSAKMVKCANVPKRQVHIPTEFQSLAHYKQVFTTALMEHLHVLLFELSQKFHKALEKVDISFYTSVKGEQEQEHSAPLCNHKIATKLVTVKKEGRNKGRLFYACDAPKADRCNFFKWLDDVQPAHMESRSSVVLHDVKSIGTYLRCHKIPLYEECQLLMRKTFDIQRKQFSKLKKNIAKVSFDADSKTKLYLKLNRKEHSSVYSKDDLWVVSKTLNFEPLDTFIACSVFFGPSSSNEVELAPLKGYSPSNWCSNMIVHALLVCNASTELTTLRNIEEYLNSATLPILHHLLAKPCKNIYQSKSVKKQKFKPPALNTNIITSGVLSPEITMNLANKMIETFQLNKDQSVALTQIGAMMTSQEIEIGKHCALPITVIHGKLFYMSLNPLVYGYDPILLRTQYRCHPAISAIANDLFYEGTLLNGISEMDRSPLIDWLPTLCFYNVNGLEQMERDNSFHNMAESFFIVKLIQSMIASGVDGSMIGVITLYKSQMSKICNLLGAVQSDASKIKAVQVSTVDAFQGAEKEIIVLSCVRTRQVGFIDSEKRVNVALTRGKRHLSIVGNLNCLKKNKVWGSVIRHCTERENGLQHVSQCERQLNDIIKSYLERKKAEETKKQLEKSKSKSFSQNVDG
ncbi:protein ZGRF1 [Sceloporus undulatus]|uniref:protein ZGRF1 n=1 Tax=Sceloporus undulatus TaxID=8520 RepID=UPI001C4B5ADC|nr:protein ZGRF1 [Sceloporus undulatus]